MQLKEFDFDLPKSLIAKSPTLKRDHCKLLVSRSGNLTDLYFYQIIDFLEMGDVLILNNTKVLRSLIEINLNNFHKSNISFNLTTQVHNNIWLAFCKNSKKIKSGDIFIFNKHKIKVLEKQENGEILIEFILQDITLDNFLDKYAKMPIPEYIKKARKETNECTDKFNELTKDINQEEFLCDLNKNINTIDINITNADNTDIDMKKINDNLFDKLDTKLYQTVYNKFPGSIASPTAGLHFTHELLDKIAKKGIKIRYITLHVGIGTYKPIKTENIHDHKMHKESVHVPLNVIFDILEAKQNNKKIFAVGTTSLRSIESSFMINSTSILQIQNNLSKLDNLNKLDRFNKLDALNKLDELNKLSIMNKSNEISNLASLKKLDELNKIELFAKNNNLNIQEYFDTNIYIKEGYKFLCIDCLITNFHLPKSSLLVLVSSFIGHENMKKTYQYAIKNQYKFYSYGDACLLFLKANN